jgi:hypothetical protein|tara:strand:+ start:891 stop:1400 length:510 start_codon:yes stop_codon:yes gene_type:complete
MRRILFLLFFILLAGMVFAESNKVYVVAFRYENGQLFFHDKMVKFGYSPDRNLMSGDYSGRILSKDGSELYAFKFNVPLERFVDLSDLNTGKISGGVVKVDKTNFAIVLPYFNKAESIKIYDPDYVRIINIDVKEIEGPNYKMWINISLLVVIVGIVIAIAIRRRKLYK